MSLSDEKFNEEQNNEFDENVILKPWSLNPLLQRLLKSAG